MDTELTGNWVATPACFICHNHAVVELSDDEMAAVNSGILIQDALANRDAVFRELFISGTHEHCWETMFGDDEEV